MFTCFPDFPTVSLNLMDKKTIILLTHVVYHAVFPLLEKRRTT